MTDVRPAAFSDVAQIVEVHVAGWHVGYRRALAASKPFWVSSPRRGAFAVAGEDRPPPTRVHRRADQLGATTTPPYAPPPTGPSKSSTAASDTPPLRPTTPPGPSTHQPPLDS